MHFRSPLALLPLLGLTATASPILSNPRAADTEAAAGCSAVSWQSMAWTARAFDFHASYVFTTPAHQNSWGYASFDLLNPADGSTARCEAASNQLSDFFYGTVQYTCNDTRTTFDFSRPANQLRVKQSWVCNDQDPQWPTKFTGAGNVNLTLECTDTTWQNQDWSLGQVYSSRDIKCAPVDTEIKPTELSAVA